MKTFKPGDQVVFRVDNEYLTGEIVAWGKFSQEWIIRESGKVWMISPYNVFYPEEVMK